MSERLAVKSNLASHFESGKREAIVDKKDEFREEVKTNTIATKNKEGFKLPDTEFRVIKHFCPTTGINRTFEVDVVDYSCEECGVTL